MKGYTIISLSILTSSFLLFPNWSFSQKQTVVFAQRDTQVLKMDIYPPAGVKKSNPCVIFVFGGGFLTGSRDEKTYSDYFKSLSDSGYLVASIDYRLGLKGATKPPTLFNRRPLIHSINIAVEDLFSATQYLLRHAVELQIDTSKIIVSGSSAGAITVLTADYRKRNDYDQKLLPSSFQYAGIISFAGAIYSNHGHPKYVVHPAPMLLFHGNNDKIVPFKKIALFGTGMYGSSAIIKRFKKIDAPYRLMVFDKTGHAAAVFPMHSYLTQIHAFLREYVFQKRPLFIEANILDEGRNDRKEINFKKAFQK